MKKIISLLLMFVLVVSFAVGCTSEGDDVKNDTGKDVVEDNNEKEDTEKENSNFDLSKEILVVSREDGSGTRGAFIELTGILEKDSQGNKVDRTSKEAIIQMQTDSVLTAVAGNEYTIGYVSTGSLNDSVKALKVNGAEPTTENIKDGSYKIARPFNIATKGEISELAQDFIDFILSSDGQEIVSKSYISVSDDAEAYNGTKPAGKIVVAGSSSVTPVMEKLSEDYREINKDAQIEVQLSGSSAGMQAAMDGTADIGMASRELKDSEKEVLDYLPIAIDGIAVVVNPENTMDDIDIEDVKEVFTGDKTQWSEVE